MSALTLRTRMVMWMLMIRIVWSLVLNWPPLPSRIRSRARTGDRSDLRTLPSVDAMIIMIISVIIMNIVNYCDYGDDDHHHGDDCDAEDFGQES